MFPLHETTQRWICRAAFALVCLLPTSSLLAYALWLTTPVHRQLQAGGLSHRTGTLVSLDDLAYPQPGVTRLTNVTLAHSHSAEELMRVRELELHRQGDSLTVIAAQPQIAAAHIDEMWRQLDRRLLQESFPNYKSLRLVAHDVTIRGDDGEAQTLKLFEAEFRTAGKERTLAITYQLAGDQKSTPATLSLLRQDQDAWHVRWQTGDAELPLAPWAEQLPWLAGLGSDCRFRGSANITHSAGGLSGNMQGKLSHVDLDQLISDNLAHKLSGQANVVLHNARFKQGRLLELHADIEAGPGVIGAPLIEETAGEWSLTLNGDPSTTSKPLRKYDRLAAEVRLADGDLYVAGTLPEAPAGTVLALTDGTQLTTKENATFDPASLIRILSSAEDANVPATESTRHLIRWLPLAKEKTGDAAEARPTAHLRGGP